MGLQHTDRILLRGFLPTYDTSLWPHCTRRTQHPIWQRLCVDPFLVRRMSSTSRLTGERICWSRRAHISTGDEAVALSRSVEWG